MASAELRKAAGAAGHAAPESAETKPSRRKRRSKEEELKVLRPVRLEFKIERDGADIWFAVPSEFALGDIVDRGALDDLEQYWMLVMIELQNVAPEGTDVRTLLYNPGPYLSAALSAGNVKKSLRRIAAKVSRILNDGEITTERVTQDELEQLSFADSLTMAIWFLRRYADLAKQSKNFARTTKV